MSGANEIDRQEEFTVRGGEGLFEFRGGGFDQALLFRGTPVALLWCDCEGSIGQFLVRSRRSLDVSAEIRHLRHVTDGGFDPDRPIAPQIGPLLALFSSGPYRLTYQAALRDGDVIGFAEAASLLDRRDSFYPFDGTLVTTRPHASLDAGRVEHYRARLASGVRPVVLTVCAAFADFVLDGHHKLAAYQSLDSRPAVIGLEPLAPPPLEPEIARDAFADAPSFYEGYLGLKNRYGR